MRGEGRKRKKHSTTEGMSNAQRSRDDIQEFNLESVIPEKEKVSDVVKKTRALHCRECDNKFTSQEALNRHNQLKTNNIGNQVILARTYKSDGSQTISCREAGCCYSCNEIGKIYAHDRFEHGSKNFAMGYRYRLISVVNVIDGTLSENENYCHKCLKNFTKKSVLDKHKLRCTGKQLFACSICGHGFQTHNEMITHIKKMHKPDSSFKTIGVFTGRAKLVSKSTGGKTPLGRVYEKCHVPQNPGLKHINQVLTPQLKKEINFFLIKQIALNTVMNFHFVLCAIIAKPESGGEVKRIRFTNRTQTERISRSTNIRERIEVSAMKLQKLLDTLSNTPSGFYCESIKSITIVYAPRPPVSGGCGSGELSRQVNSVGSTSRRGLLDIKGEPDKCFRDGVLCSLFSKELFLKYIKEEEEKCTDHRRCCSCRDLAEKLFNTARKKGIL